MSDAPTPPGPPSLERALERHVPSFSRDRLRAARGDIELLREDPLVLRAGGRQVCSATNPLGEARRWAERQELAPGDVLVVFGVGAGHHLLALSELAVRRERPGAVLVVEPDSAQLAAVLQRHPSLPDVEATDDPQQVRGWVAKRLTVGRNARLLVWPAAARRHGDAFTQVREGLAAAVELSEITLRTLRKRSGVWIEHLLLNLPQAVGSVLASGLKGWLAGRPAILVAAGPSLALNVQDLKRVEGRAAIIAVNTSLGALERAGVRADLVVVLEALDVSEQFAGLALNRDVPRLLSIGANPALFADAPGPVLPFVEDLQGQRRIGAAAGFRTIPAGGSVANAAFALAYRLGASQLIVAGQDLAYRDDRVYAPGTLFESMRVTLDDDRTASFSGIEAKRRIAESRPEVADRYDRGAVLRTTAWGGEGEVVTTEAFNYFRHIFEHWARTAEAEAPRLINATEGGARIAGFEELPLAEVVDALPAASAGPWPTEPVLEAGALCAALERELADVRVVNQVAASLASGCDELTDQVTAELHLLRERVEDCGLFHAYAFSELLGLIVGEERSPRALGRRLAERGERLAERLGAALAASAKKKRGDRKKN